ncbi:hypothetical protein [Allorhodopirellula solitaria]|uniref:Uncharacterized protein n=1 Tax=Allorhodopirellula solitaria TaxID=2527987 RepID=A0A5C5XUW1_9BACT|nr:hypothetical protein [Allorhodopirellula solitaria]TWT66351.1 hypothetical protein CA85_24450 [Allorhodopirellula solitaria]
MVAIQDSLTATENCTVAARKTIAHTEQFYHFPKLGVRIQISLSPHKPPRLDTELSDKLFRSDFRDGEWSSLSQAGLSPAERSQRRHDICNRLQIAGFSLDVLEQQCAEGDLEVASTLEIVLESLSQLEQSC